MMSFPPFCLLCDVCLLFYFLFFLTECVPSQLSILLTMRNWDWGWLRFGLCCCGYWCVGRVENAWQETWAAQITIEKCRTTIWLSFASLRNKQRTHHSQWTLRCHQTQIKKKCEIIRTQYIRRFGFGYKYFCSAHTSNQGKRRLCKFWTGYTIIHMYNHRRWCRCLNNNLCDIHFESSIHFFLYAYCIHTTCVPY